MSFSASTCLSYTGTTNLINPISIYSDFDGYSSPFTAVTLSDITSDNCPFILTNIPDGTTTLKLKSSNNYCCNIVLECNDLCTTCDLSFDSYSTDLISRIIAGNLTGSCDNNITNYRINWYKNPDFSTPIFSSGYGTEFTPYNYTHPLVGNTSPMQPSGTYTPIIDKITINGLNYSQTEEPGFIQDNLECFNTLSVNVLPFTCNNGGEIIGDYTHRVNYSGSSVGIAPLTLTSTFQLSDTTNYFAWKFKAFTVYDSLKITFSGSSYSEPLVLEYYTLGFNNIVSSNIDPLIYHKTGRTSSDSFYSKITSLENITTNIGDYLILEVTPNQTNPQTIWDFYFTCLDTFDCSLCLDSYINTNAPYKIKLDSLTNVSGSCESTVVSFNLSGCSTDSFYNSYIGKYMVTSLYSQTLTNLSSVFFNSLSNIGTVQVNANNGSVICGLSGSGTLNGVCSPYNSNSISFQKSVSMGQGIINMTFSHLSDLSSYYNAILPYSGMTFPSTDIRYYKYIQLNVPKSTSPGQICGDGTSQITYYFHPSFVMTSGGTTGNYTLDMTMPTISKNISFTSCELYCDNYVNQVVNGINISSTGSTNNESFSSTTGSRYTQSTTTVIWNMGQTILNVASGQTSSGIYYFSDYTNVTIPFSGSGVSYTPIPSLSAQTCDMTGIGQASYEPGLREIYIYDYRTIFPDTNDLTSYTIKASPIVNGVSNNSYSVDVITVVNNVVTYSNPLYTY